MARPRLRYQTLEFGDVDIHLRTLRDNQQFSDDDGIAAGMGISSATWPIFGVVWASGEVLARLMLHHEVAGKRILEVGCGIALTSLVLRHRGADITATDHHPEAGRFLQENTRLNHLDSIPFTRTGWADEDCGLGRFDLIVGSDLLYDTGHAGLLAGFIERHATRHAQVIIVDPGRGQLARFGREMSALGYEQSACELPILDPPFPGKAVCYDR